MPDMTGNRFHEWQAKRQTQPLNPVAEAAVEFSAAFGVPVFPCALDKRPLTGRGFKDASADPATIRAMFQGRAAAFIGMPTGEASGYTVIDIDVKEGAQGDVWLGANAHRLPATRTSRTRSGGSHWWYRYVPGVRNSASKIAPGVDVRGEGGYIIVPPSEGYTWAKDIDHTDMPQWLALAANPPEPVHVPRAPVYRPVSLDGGTAYGLAALADECNAIRNAFQGTKHATLNKAAYSIGGLVTAGELQEGTAMAELAGALADIRASCKDFRAAERTLRQSFQDGMGKPREAPEPMQQGGISPEERADLERLYGPLMVKMSARHAEMVAKLARAQAEPLPVAPELFDVPGLLGMFIDHCEATAPRSQPFFALAAGLCLVGVLAGRRYRTSTNLRTNVFAIGVGDSGSGKDHARKKAKAVLFDAGLGRFLGGEKIASGQALLSALEKHPASLFMVDEFGDVLDGMSGEKAAAHKKEIVANLKTAYTSAGDTMLGTEYANQEKRPRVDIVDPHACLYATTSPKQLWDAVTAASLHDGLMARMLVFVTPDAYPDALDPEFIGIPPDLIDAALRIARGPGQVAALPPGNIGVEFVTPMSCKVSADPATVPETPAATLARKALKTEETASLRQHAGTYMTTLAARTTENAMKLALIRAISRDPEAPLITEADVAWGRALTQHCINSLIREADTNIAESEYDRKLKRVLEVLRKHGGTMTKGKLLDRGVKALGNERERDDLIRTLVQSGEVLETRAEGGVGKGQPTIRYALANRSHPEN